LISSPRQNLRQRIAWRAFVPAKKKIASLRKLVIVRSIEMVNALRRIGISGGHQSRGQNCRNQHQHKNANGYGLPMPGESQNKFIQEDNQSASRPGYLATIIHALPYSTTPPLTRMSFKFNCKRVVPFQVLNSSVYTASRRVPLGMDGQSSPIPKPIASHICLPSKRFNFR